MSTPYLGQIIMFGGNFAIKGWALCNGQTLSISANSALFSIIGTYYGGNGTSNFQLPNLQGRVPIHQGTGQGLTPYVVGQNGGTENTTLLTQNMPIHSHTVNAVGGAANQTTVGNALLANGAKPDYYSSGSQSTTMNAQMIAPAGGNLPFSNLQPYLTVTFLIALVGIFPSRN
jgi:microcystin-dependent protein